MKSQIRVAGDELTIRDNHANPRLPLALAVLAALVFWRNVVSPSALVVGIGLIIVALIGFVRSTAIIDLKYGTVTVTRSLLGMSMSARYEIRRVKAVDNGWSKFGDTLVMKIDDGRNSRLIRIAGPTHADLAPMVREVRQHLERA